MMWASLPDHLCWMPSVVTGTRMSSLSEETDESSSSMSFDMVIFRERWCPRGSAPPLTTCEVPGSEQSAELRLRDGAERLAWF